MPRSGAPPRDHDRRLAVRASRCARPSAAAARRRAPSAASSASIADEPLSNALPASRPMKSRIAVPALPMSSALRRRLQPVRARRRRRGRVPPGCRDRTPRRASAAHAWRGSLRFRGNRAPPWCLRRCAPSISARCEIDLSPGTVMLPADDASPAWHENVAYTADMGLVKARPSGYEPSTLNSDARVFRSRRAPWPRCSSLGMAVEVDEEHVVPFALARRPRLDARHVHPVPRERLEQVQQRAGRFRAPSPTRATWSCRCRSDGNSLRPTTTNRVVLSVAVLDLAEQDLELVDLRRRVAGDRCGALLVARAPRALRRCSRREPSRRPASARASQPRHCASDCGCEQTRWMSLEHRACCPSGADGCAARSRRRSSSGEVRNMSSVWMLTVPSVEFSMGTTPKSAVPASTSWNTSSIVRQRQRAHRVAEVLEHRRLRERAFRPEVRDLQRLLLREAGRHDLAEQPHHLFVAQRPVVAARRPCAAPVPRARADRNRRLAVDALRDADFLRAARPLGDQRLDALVDGVDLAAQLLRAIAADCRRSPLAAAAPA